MTLVANTRKTAVRIGNTVTVVFSDFFHMGEKMNENTHVFDASFFEHNGKTRCFMAALPVEIAEELAAEGAKAAGGIHRIECIETAEHLAFRKLCPEYESAVVFLPQDGGLRLLFIAENLPSAAHFISNDPAHRADEFLLFYNALEAPPQIALVENETEFSWLGELLPAIQIIMQEV